MYSHPYPLLQAFPWFSSAILDSSGISELLESKLPNRVYGSAAQSLAKRLEVFERTHGDPTDSDDLRIRRILLSDPSVLVQERLADLNALKSDKLSNLVSHLLDYRLLDIALLLDRGFEEVAGQLHRLPIPQPAKMHYKQASDWPSLVSRGLQLFRDCDDHSVPALTSDRGDPTATILKSLIWRREAIEGHKIMANFECTAAYLSLILKGCLELPSNIPDFKDLIMRMCDQTPFPAEGSDTFFGCLKSVHSFKLPLQLSLAVSPVCLFLPSCLMTKDLNRFLLIQMWQGLGGLRPALLFKVELVLWKALFDAASGTSPLSPRLRAAFCEVGMVELDRVGFPSSEWLQADPTLQDSLQLQHKERRPETPGSKWPTARNDVTFPNSAKLPHRDELDGTGDQMSATAGASAYERPLTRSVTAKLQPRGTRPENTTTSARASSLDRPRKHGKQRAVNSGNRHHSDMEEDDSDGEVSQALSRKRANSTGSLGTEHIMKALKLEDGSRKKIYETIDLTSETPAPRVIDLTVESAGQDRAICSTPCSIWSLDGSTSYAPRFHFLQEGEWFTSLFKAMKERQCGDLPPFLSHLPSSLFTPLNVFQATQLPIPDMQRHARERVIVLAGTSAAVPFNEKTLAAFAMLDKPVQIRDFSLPPQSDRTTTGTLTQLLYSAQTGGKALLAPDFSMPGGVSPLPSLASDAYAWDMTMDMPWCGRRWEMPRTDVRWTEVATRDAYRPLEMSYNGFATHIEIKTGSQLLVVAKPSEFNPHSSTSFTVLEHFRRPYTLPTKTFDYQAIQLRAGYTAIIPALVPFMLMATDNSITSMCHFYPTSTLWSSCIGLLHSSLALDATTNRAQKAAISLLRRFVHYFHSVYLSDDYIAQKQYYPHVPDVLTSSGVVDILTLCNIFEVINALAYTLTDLERHQLVEARRLCRRIVAWMGSRFSFCDKHGEPLDLYHQLWMVYLAQEVRALHVYQDILERNQVSTARDIRSRLSACLKDHVAFRTKFDHFPSRMPDQFGWLDDSEFSVTLRFNPGSVPDDIRGETAEDLAYFRL